MDSERQIIDGQLGDAFQRMVVLEASHAELIVVLELALLLIESTPSNDEGRNNTLQSMRTALTNARKL